MEKDDNYFENLKTEFLVIDTAVFRFGSIGDGGYYLRPSTIQNSKVLFSGGISSNLEFEYDLFRFNEELMILMVDPTVSAYKLIGKGLVRLFFTKPEKIRYLINALTLKLLLKSQRCVHLKLWLNKDQRILDLIKAKFNIDRRILLKLDIEGSEYDFLEEIIKNLASFNAMVFEFHDVHLKHHLVHDFIKTCNSEFKLVHLSDNPAGGYDSNNRPKNIEISLERRD